jgi:hypothetical protein
MNAGVFRLAPKLSAEPGTPEARSAPVKRPGDKRVEALDVSFNEALSAGLDEDVVHRRSLDGGCEDGAARAVGSELAEKGVPR